MAYINYLLLDASRMKTALSEAKALNSNFRSLFKGRSEIDLEFVAPYIFSYVRGSEFSDWYMKNGWGKGWGIMLRSPASMDELHEHCRKFLLVEDEDKQELYFRFYDPRILSIFLPTCSSEQLKHFFGPIDYFMIENKDGDNGQMMWLESYELRKKKIDRDELERRLQSDLNFDSSNKDAAQIQNTKASLIIGKDQKQEIDRIEPDIITTETSHSPEMNKADNNSKWNKFFFE
jgi:hypothetical protein